MKTLICLFCGFLFFNTFQLTAQDVDQAREDLPRVVLTSNESVDQFSWQRIESLHFFNQSDQVVQLLNQMSKSGHLEPDAQLALAHNLKKMGQYDQARDWYEEYRTYDYKIGQHFVSSCKKASILGNKWEMQRIAPISINSVESEYSPCSSKNGLVFFRMTKSKPGSSNACSYDIFVADGEEDTFSEASPYNQRFEIPENVVFMDISPSGNKILFTRLTDQSCFNGFLTTEGMAIYEAELTATGDWQNIRPLPFNAVGQRTAYASYGQNDDVVYYASDVPSGFGGFDIYRAERLSDNKWSIPQNLGPQINSDGNEITPRFNGEVLVFSSDYHEGLGGYDIFYSPLDQSRFLTPVNAGRPINSQMDDWSLSFVDQETGYFVSNRANASANANIYYFEDLTQTPQPQALKVNYPTLSKNQMKAVTAFPIEWSTEEVNAFAEKVDNKSPIKPKYSVQIAVISPNNNSFNRLQNELGDIDELYKIYFNDVVKIRLGSYDKEITASLMLEKIKARGYTDAFIVTEKMIVADEDEATTDKKNQPRKKVDTKNPKVESVKSSADKGKYFLRLATYLHPDNFDPSKVSALGEVTSLEKGPYTIFLLGHFDSVEEAQQAQSKVQERGFTNAQIIELQGQEIVRVSSK